MRGAIKLNSEQYFLDKSNLKKIIEIQNHTIVCTIYSKLWREVWIFFEFGPTKTLENMGGLQGTFILDFLSEYL